MKSKRIKKGVNNFFPKNRKAAMEMSVGTIVTIVLLMSVLILGIFLVQKIFSSSTNAIDSVDNEVQNQISQLFSEEGKKLAVYPTSRKVTIKKKDDLKGFAFSVKNLDVESAEFTYDVYAKDVSKCGSAFTEEKANSYLLNYQGSFDLGPGDEMIEPEIVVFDLDELAPPCTIVYYLEVYKGETPYAGLSIFVTIK